MNDKTFRINGIDAPEAGQKCTSERGKQWSCGDAATNALYELTRAGKVAVKPAKSISMAAISGVVLLAIWIWDVRWWNAVWRGRLCVIPMFMQVMNARPSGRKLGFGGGHHCPRGSTDQSGGKQHQTMRQRAVRLKGTFRRAGRFIIRRGRSGMRKRASIHPRASGGFVTRPRPLQRGGVRRVRVCGEAIKQRRYNV